jgi:DNA-directed RNA polymerase specialized sigma24 family protein
MTQTQRESDLVRRAVRDAVIELPDHLRIVLLQLYVQRRTVSDAAVALGVEPVTIERWATEAVVLLRGNLVRRGCM